MPRPSDTRPSQILDLVGQGQTLTKAAASVGITRKTLYRWRESVDGFKAAVEHVSNLAARTTPEAREEIERVVLAWLPGGLSVAGKLVPVMPDVLDADGEELLAGDSEPPADAIDELEPAEQPEPRELPKPRPPRKPLRGQTADEWIDLAFRLASDEKQPIQVRTTALAFGGSAVVGGPLGRKVRPLESEPDVDKVRKEIGRDPGVGRATWEQVKRNVLGPPPEADSEPTAVGDVVEMDPAARG